MNGGPLRHANHDTVIHGENMSHAIPIFILPVEERSVPPVPTVEWASKQVVEAGKAAEQSGLRQATSTNWWHCFLTTQFCRHWKIEGLEFLESELSVLTPVEIQGASSALGDLMERLKAGPWPLADADLGPELATMRSVPLADVLEAAVPVYTLDEGTGDLHSYAAFLATLAAATLEASETRRRLLFYAPQP